MQIDPQLSTPLVEQIVQRFRQQIGDRELRAGSRLPSIRSLARRHNVAHLTVVQAYDRLVAAGLVTARRGSGFYVNAPARIAERISPAAETIDTEWLQRGIFESHRFTLNAGCGWLPANWLDEASLSRGVRRLAQGSVAHTLSYGEPLGFPPLREWLTRHLADHDISCPPEQIILTQGATQAQELVMRQYLTPGDCVLVEAPGYCNLLSSLTQAGMRIIPVRRHETGLDLAELEKAAALEHPRLLFVNTVLQNPTGGGYSLACIHKTLQIAQQYDFNIVEDNLFHDLHPEPQACFAGLDQLERVIYLGSFSKTIAPGLRVGFIAASRARTAALTLAKMTACLTTSELTERLVYQILTEGQWRKHLDRLRTRLMDAQTRVAARLEALGFQRYAEPKSGMFLFARHPRIADSLELARQAAQQDILLAPGQLFLPHEIPNPWLRFNVAYSDDDRLYDFLRSALDT